MKSGFSRSMKWKLTASMSLMAVFVSTTMAAGIFHYIKRDYLNAINAGRVLVANNLATSAFEALLREDPSTITFLGEQFGRLEDVLLVMVLDRDDKVIYDSRHGLEGSILKMAAEKATLKKAVIDGVEAFEVSVPFMVGDARWTTARIVFSQSTVKKEAGLILKTVAFFCLAGILGGTTLSYFLAGMITRPLEELKRGISAIEGGDLDYRVKIKSGDELEMVGEEFNLMAVRLKGVQARLQAMVADLEDSNKKLKSAQMELLEKEKMTAILEFAGAAAHQMNQPLTVIIGNIDFLLSLKEVDEARMRKTFDTINRAAREMAEIVKKIVNIKRYETERYVGDVKILDLDKSSK